ncbi:MAG: hypothetical protein ACOZAA_13220, partial [Pseudomonadota bacterium]
RAFISDIAKGLQVRTDLRYAIFKAFKADGIEIPFPQQDIHIRAYPGEKALKPTSQRSAAENAAPPREPEDIDAADE